MPEPQPDHTQPAAQSRPPESATTPVGDRTPSPGDGSPTRVDSASPRPDAAAWDDTSPEDGPTPEKATPAGGDVHPPRWRRPAGPDPPPSRRPGRSAAGGPVRGTRHPTGSLIRPWTCPGRSNTTRRS